MNVVIPAFALDWCSKWCSSGPARLKIPAITGFSGFARDIAVADEKDFFHGILLAFDMVYTGRDCLKSAVYADWRFLPFHWDKRSAIKMIANPISMRGVTLS